MLSFWRAIFYSSLLDPIFTAVASALGVTKQVCKEYCTSVLWSMVLPCC